MAGLIGIVLGSIWINWLMDYPDKTDHIVFTFFGAFSMYLVQTVKTNLGWQ